MKKFWLIAAALPLLNGCGVMPCVDAQIERAAEPIADKFSFDIVTPASIISHTIECERYFDAQCSARGNSWKIREVGKHRSDDRSPINIAVMDGELYQLELPRCRDLLEQSVWRLADISVVRDHGKAKVEENELGRVSTWLGKRYRLQQSYATHNTYAHIPYGKPQLPPVDLAFTVSLNGQKLN